MSQPSAEYAYRRHILKQLSLEYQGSLFKIYLHSYHISKLVVTSELNGTYYDTLDRPPTSIEFSQLVNIARPVLIKGAQINLLASFI